MENKEPKVINDETTYQQTLKILNNQSRPSKILCMLMNMLEAYRQSKKMGWSRPWNKYGLTTFQTFKIDPVLDASLIQQSLQCVQTLDTFTAESLAFCQQLVSDPDQLMGFIFYSELEEDGKQFETVTLSLGNKVDGNPRYRNRFDIVFDALIQGQEVKPLNRIRIYVDPYQEQHKEPLLSLTLEQHIPDAFQVLFEQLCKLSFEWQSLADKHWDHWTSRYIDYFGPRAIKLNHSHFYMDDAG